MSARLFSRREAALAVWLVWFLGSQAMAQTIGLHTATAHFGGYAHTEEVKWDQHCRTEPPAGHQCVATATRLTHHRDFETTTLGLYVRWSSGLTLGGYSNSLGRPTWHAGWTWETAERRFAVTTSLATGYRARGFVPLIVPSARVPIFGRTSLRLSAIPKVRNSTGALHLSLEKEL